MAQTPNKLVQIKAKAIPIPYHISRFLENNAAEIKLMLKSNKVRYQPRSILDRDVFPHCFLFLFRFLSLSLFSFRGFLFLSYVFV